jgi:hypothetical protein
MVSSCAPERFQAKQNPVRVKKTRENKELEHSHVSAKRENAPGREPWLSRGA